MQAMTIDLKLKSLVASERKITHEILLLIQTLDITKFYRELGYSSLFEYLTKEIGYSEGSAQRRISSARLMKQVPIVEQKLQSGELNLTQVSLAQTAIRQEEKAARIKISNAKKVEILEQLKFKSTFETQKVLKECLPHFEIPKPKAVPAGSDTVCVTMEFSSKDWEKVQSLMAHFSHSVPDQKLESLLLYWCDQLEKKKQKQRERIEKSERPVGTEMSEGTASIENKYSEIPASLQNTNSGLPNASKNDDLSSHEGERIGAAQKTSHGSVAPCDLNKSLSDLSAPENSPPLRRRKQVKRIKAAVKVKIQLRDRAQDQCEYVSSLTGKRCSCKVFLEDEHIIPLAKGGSNSPSNLRLFCRSHNQLMAKAWGVSQE